MKTISWVEAPAADVVVALASAADGEPEVPVPVVPELGVVAPTGTSGAECTSTGWPVGWTSGCALGVIGAGASVWGAPASAWCCAAVATAAPSYMMRGSSGMKPMVRRRFCGLFPAPGLSLRLRVVPPPPSVSMIYPCRIGRRYWAGHPRGALPSVAPDLASSVSGTAYAA